MIFTVYNLVYLIICIVEALIACQYFEGLRAYEGSVKIRLAAFAFAYGMIFLLHFLSDNIWMDLAVFFALNFLLGYFIYRISPRTAAVYTGLMAGAFIVAEWMMNGIMNSMLIMSGGSQRSLGYITLLRNAMSDDSEKNVYGMAPIYTASALSCLSVVVLAYVEMKQLVTGAMEWLVICVSCGKQKHRLSSGWTIPVSARPAARSTERCRLTNRTPECMDLA